MGSDALYNEQALLRKAVRFVWAVSHVWTAPRPPYWRGAKEGAGSACGAEVYAGSTRPLLCAAIWRRFLWEVIHSIMSGGFYGK